MSLVDDLNINIEDTPHDEDHLDTTLQDPNDLSINLNEKVHLLMKILPISIQIDSIPSNII